MRKVWSTEEIEWIRNNKDKFSSRHEVVVEFNKKFNSDTSFNKVISICKRHGISLRYNNFSWEEKIKWLKENKHKYDDREDILNDLNKHFNTNYTLVHIKDMNTKCKLNLPLAKRRINQGLKNGRIKLMGVSQREIGEESYRSGENVYIKTDNTKEFKNNFTLKHRYLYEQYHNVKLTNDDCIIFLDNNHNNFNKENLYKISRKVHSLMSGYQLHNTRTEKEIVIKCLEWKEKIIYLKKFDELEI